MSVERPRPLVVVTRAAEQSGGLRKRLVEAGYDVLEVPVIEIVDPEDGGAALDRALDRLHDYDWLVVTSPNGGARVRAALEGRSASSRPRVAAVGPGTAEAVGVPVDLVATTSIGEGIVDDFATGPGRVLLVQAATARPVVAEGLRSKGWQVDAVVGYRTVPAHPGSALIERARTADAVVFTSGSTVRHFVAAAGVAGVPPVVVSIGPATTAVAEQVGVQVTVTATVHTLDGVVTALIGEIAPGNPRSHS
jgi:uroporphyrinogen-III synthase